MSSVKSKCNELSDLSMKLKEVGTERHPGMFSIITYPYIQDHPELKTDELSQFYRTNIQIPSKKIIELREQHKKTVILEIVEELNFLGFEIGYNLTTGEDIYSYSNFKEIFYKDNEYLLCGVVKQVVREAIESLNDSVVDLTPFWSKNSKIFIGDSYSWHMQPQTSSVEYITDVEKKINEYVLENKKISKKIVELGERIASFDYETNIDFIGKGTHAAARNRLDISNMLNNGERSLEQHEKLREAKEKK